MDEQGEKFKVHAYRRLTGLDCYKKMIEAGGVDIIAILTPPYFHPEQVEAAVEGSREEAVFPSGFSDPFVCALQ